MTTHNLIMDPKRYNDILAQISSGELQQTYWTPESVMFSLPLVLSLQPRNGIEYSVQRLLARHLWPADELPSAEKGFMAAHNLLPPAPVSNAVPAFEGAVSIIGGAAAIIETAVDMLKQAIDYGNSLGLPTWELGSAYNARVDEHEELQRKNETDIQPLSAMDESAAQHHDATLFRYVWAAYELAGKPDDKNGEDWQTFLYYRLPLSHALYQLPPQKRLTLVEETTGYDRDGADFKALCKWLGAASVEYTLGTHPHDCETEYYSGSGPLFRVRSLVRPQAKIAEPV